jgi:hypothetical protein
MRAPRAESTPCGGRLRDHGTDTLRRPRNLTCLLVAAAFRPSQKRGPIARLRYLRPSDDWKLFGCCEMVASWQFVLAAALKPRTAHSDMTGRGAEQQSYPRQSRLSPTDP